jgi:glycosyltransferase involved in cell wall biosynthesis
VNPRVSVVMPAFQASAWIGAAVSSVLTQTYRDLELVVVDDGSTDATPQIVAAQPGPTKLVTQPNAGVGAARNRGIAEARGRLVAFCDADDFLLPDHVGALVSLFDRKGGIVTSNPFVLFPSGIDPRRRLHRIRFPPPHRQRRAILEQNFVSTMSLFPRAMVEAVGPFAEHRRRAEDWDFWIRAIFTGYRVALQPRPLAFYRWTSTGLSAGENQMDAEDVAILRDVASRLPLTADERRYVQRRLSHPPPRELARRADGALREGRYAEAARDYREAAMLCPSERLLVWKARLMALAPHVAGPVLRARHVRLERTLGTGARVREEDECA